MLAPDERLEDWGGWKVFVAELAGRGYVEGNNFSFVRRYSGRADPNRLDAMAAELVALKVDLIFAVGGTRSAMAAKNATATAPIVFLGSADPVGYGLVATLRHPEGNVTGNATLAGETLSKSPEILVATVGTGHAIARISQTLSALPSFGLERDILLATARTLNARISSSKSIPSRHSMSRSIDWYSKTCRA